MQLKYGKRYITRDGRVTEPLERGGSTRYLFEASVLSDGSLSRFSWTSAGHSLGEDQKAGLDLVSEYVELAEDVPVQEQNTETLGTTPEKLPSGITATLAERGSRYGEFKDHAVYADGVNAIYLSSPNWPKMAPDQREALRIIANKLGRILNGDPDYSDSWHDIVGYAKLVDDRLKGEGK